MLNTITRLLTSLANGQPLKSGLVSSVLSNAQLIPYEKRDSWIVFGERIDHIGIIKTGTAIQFRYHEKKQNILALYGKSDYLIEGTTLLPKPAIDDRIIFVEPSEVVMLKISDLRAIQSEFEQLSMIFEYLISHRLHEIHNYLYNHKFLPTCKRLDHILEQKKDSFIKLTSLQKASLLGVSKQSLYNITWSRKT